MVHTERTVHKCTKWLQVRLPGLLILCFQKTSLMKHDFFHSHSLPLKNKSKRSQWLCHHGTMTPWTELDEAPDMVFLPPKIQFLWRTCSRNCQTLEGNRWKSRLRKFFQNDLPIYSHSSLLKSSSLTLKSPFHPHFAQDVPGTNEDVAPPLAAAGAEGAFCSARSLGGA